MPSGVRVIGIDPGINHTGYGVVDEISKKMICLDEGTVSPSKKLAFPQRLQVIYKDLKGLIEKWFPDIMVVEETIYAQNIRTALMMGQARGVVILAAVEEGLEIYEYSPKKIKLSVVGNGAATKEQVRFMVTRLLNLPEVPVSFDASDALAVALCHLNQNRILVDK